MEGRFSGRLEYEGVKCSAVYHSQVLCSRVDCSQVHCSIKNCSQIHCSKINCSHINYRHDHFCLDYCSLGNSFFYNADTAATYSAIITLQSRTLESCKLQLFTLQSSTLQYYSRMHDRITDIMPPVSYIMDNID